MNRLWLVSCMGCILMCSLVHAASVTEVRVAVGKVGEIVFPEKIAKVIKGGPTESVLIEVMDNSIYILPKSNTPADIFVTGISGTSYPLKLALAAEHDVRVEVNGASVKRISRENHVDAMGLMKDVLLGRMPAGATVLNSGKTIMLGDGKIQMTVDVIYDFPHIAAYIFQARNLTGENVIVPVEHIAFPHLLAVNSSADMLNPKGQDGDAAKVYLIAGK